MTFDATGGPIAWGAPLPDGTLTIAGDWLVASSRERYHLVLATLQPLVYDDACGGFVGGVLQATGDGGEVQITWTACGVHTSTFIAGLTRPGSGREKGRTAVRPFCRAFAAPLPRCPAAPPTPSPTPSRQPAPAPHPRWSGPPPPPQSW